MEISTEKITLSYGASEILKGISTKVQSGEFVGLIGPNGSGKSTLLKCIYRVLKPDGGCVWLGDQELREIKIRDSARKTAVVAQHNYYNFEFTVREVVRMGRAPHKKLLEETDGKTGRSWNERLGRFGWRHLQTENFPPCQEENSSE